MGGLVFDQGLVLHNVGKCLGILGLGRGLDLRCGLGGLVHSKKVKGIQLLADMEEGGFEDPVLLKGFETGHFFDSQGPPGGDKGYLHEVGLEFIVGGSTSGLDQGHRCSGPWWRGGRDRVSGCWETATGANIGEVNPGRPGYDGLDMV